MQIAKIEVVTYGMVIYLNLAAFRISVAVIGWTGACFYFSFFYYSLRMYMENALYFLIRTQVLCTYNIGTEYLVDNLTLASIYYRLPLTAMLKQESSMRQSDTHRQKSQQFPGGGDQPIPLQALV